MKFKSCFPSLKIFHSKGCAVFKNGFYETNDKTIIDELKKDKNIIAEKSILNDSVKNTAKSDK